MFPFPMLPPGYADQTVELLLTDAFGGTVDITYVIRWDKSLFIASGSSIRLTIRASAAGTFTFTDSFVGNRASSGDAYDFETTPTRVTWDGGSNGATVSAGATKVSDIIPFAFSNALDLLVTFDITSGEVQGEFTAGANFGRYFKAGAGDAATVNKTGYTNDEGNPAVVQKVEIFGP